MKVDFHSMLRMKKKLMKDMLIRYSNTSENPSSSADKVIEFNVNMNVSLLNEKKSRVLQTTQSSLIIILTVIFLIAHYQLRRDIQTLEVQMNSINSKLAIFILMDESRHKNSNETNTQQESKIKFQSDHDNNEMSLHDTISSRALRSIITLEKHSETEKTTMLNAVNNVKIDQSTIWDDSRAGRMRRDVGRGPIVATFVGAVPEQHVTDTVYIGPWVKKNESYYGFNKFHLVEDKRSIEVTANGLFMISTQIYYFGEPTHYSYWILLSSEGSSITRKVIKCATVSAVSATETSCYTSIILPLRRGDRLHIQQQERDRLINLRDGHSYIQITLLSNDQQKKRATTSVDRL